MRAIDDYICVYYCKYNFSIIINPLETDNCYDKFHPIICSYSTLIRNISSRFSKKCFLVADSRA